MDPATTAKLRFPAECSRGRRYPEPAHLYRNAFQRDRDRVVHSRAFRRLADKTQVFAERYSDHFRNRLTHTMEVAQIARTVAFSLGLDEDLTEALALAHDLGHPPFGHAGERELDSQMKCFGGRFDHNLHALRIVDRFEQRYAAFRGLNLTFEVREGIVKHSRELLPGESPELDEFLPGLRPVLEAQLIDLADEAAYNTADLDDGHEAGLVDVDELAARIEPFGRLWALAGERYPAISERARFLECVRKLVNLLASSLIEGTRAAVARARVETVDDVRGLDRRLGVFTAQGAELNTALKAYLHDSVYSAEALVEERQRSRAAVADLFAFLLAHPDRLPEGYREEAESEPLHRVVCDYIAGMTDGFLRKTWRQLCGGAC